MSSPAASKRTLLILRRSPYGSSLSRAGIDTALAFAAFDQEISLLFAGDGVLQLLPDQDTGLAGVRNLGRLLASLPLYDIEQVYVDAAAAARYGVDLADAPLATVALDGDGIRRLLDDHDHLLGF